MKRLVSLIVLVFILSSTVGAVSIPYEGLNLKWDADYNRSCNMESLNQQQTRDLIYQYKDKEGSLMTVQSVGSNSTTLRYNVDTREIKNGSDKGNKTSHWINTNVSIGDEVSILGQDFNVVSKSETIELEGEQIQTVKVQGDTSQSYITNDGVDVSISGVEDIWYHKTFAILLSIQ